MRSFFPLPLRTRRIRCRRSRSVTSASEEVAHRYRRQQAEDQIRAYFEKATPAERDSVTDLVFRTARPKAGRPSGAAPVVVLDKCLPELSLVDVEDIAALVRWPAAA